MTKNTDGDGGATLIVWCILLIFVLMIVWNIYLINSYEEVCVDLKPDELCECGVYPVYEGVHSCSCKDSSFLTNDVFFVDGKVLSMQKGYCREYRIVRYVD